MWRESYGEGRRLYDRGSAAGGLVVDEDGAALGPVYPLVERTGDGYRAIGPAQAGILLRTVFDDYRDPMPLVGLCRAIAKALDRGDVLRAQLLGLQVPVDDNGQLIARMTAGGFQLAPGLMVVTGASAKARSRTETLADKDRPEVCPNPTPAAEFMSASSAAYQAQITGLAPGLVVRLNGVKFDGCEELEMVHMQDAKGPGIDKFMIGPTTWQRWFRGVEGILDQMDRQEKAANGLPVDWYFAEPRVAEFFRNEAIAKKFHNIHVHYVPAVIQ